MAAGLPGLTVGMILTSFYIMLFLIPLFIPIVVRKPKDEHKKFTQRIYSRPRSRRFELHCCITDRSRCQTNLCTCVLKRKTKCCNHILFTEIHYYIYIHNLHTYIVHINNIAAFQNHD